MAGISVCMIVKNEEEVLARCLACVTSFADEIIVVDTGSTDRQRKLRPASRINYMILHGAMIFPRRVTIPFPRQHRTLSCGWMRMM